MRIEIPVKFNMIRPTHKSTKVSSKVYLGNANRVLRKDVFKPCSIATCNLTHKAAKVPHVKLGYSQTIQQPVTYIVSKSYQIFVLKHSQTNITCQHK